VLLLLLMLFAQLAFGARRLSLTSDELPHFASGYTYLARGETWHIPSLGNPPLILAWIGLPVLLGAPDIPVETLPNWGDPVLQPYFRAMFPLLGPIQRLEVAGRTPVMLLAVVLGGLVYRWAADHFGPSGGILALTLVTFDPTLLAHSQLATIDTGVTLLGFATFFIAQRATSKRRQRAAWAGGVGLLAGLTLAAKMSGLIWVGLALGTKFVLEVSTGKGPMARRWRQALSLALITSSVAVCVLWAVYGFRIGPIQLAGRSFPLPATNHWRGLGEQMSSPALRLMYLAGETKHGGWWWYFPLAYLIKNPLPLLVVWISGLGLLIWRQRRRPTILAFLLGFPIVYSLIAMASGLNIGYRHMLPVHPFLHVVAAQWATVRVDTGRRHGIVQSLLRITAAVLIAWYVAGALTIYPHYLVYFNEAVGGPEEGYRYLVDSNLDWGQEYKALKRTLAQVDTQPPLRIGHRWYVGPEQYGIEYEPLPPLPAASTALDARLDPPPGTYALGATLLYRGYGDLSRYEWFRHQAPIARPGYGLFVFEVEPHEPSFEGWIAQCNWPAAPLNAETIQAEFHSPPQHALFFDCRQSWLYPDGGEVEGWYAFHQDALNAGGAFLADHTARTERVYVHKKDDTLAPAFQLFRHRPGLRVAPTANPVWPAQVESARDLTTALKDVALPPVRLDGPLTFLGYRRVPSEETLVVETWWEVQERPTRPLSVMAHWVDDSGRHVAVADGLGVPIDSWRVGDVLVQAHRFPGVQETDGWFVTGAYWLDTQARHPLSDMPNSDSLFIRLDNDVK
jgi:hypothetical protein